MYMPDQDKDLMFSGVTVVDVESEQMKNGNLRSGEPDSEKGSESYDDNTKLTVDSISEEPNSSSTRNLSKRQKLFISCFVGISLLVVVVVSVAMTQGAEFFERDARQAADRKFTLDEIFSGKFSFERYEADWISDQSYLHTNADGVVKYNMDTSDTKPREIVMTRKEVGESNIVDIKELNSDKTWFLFANNTEPLYRHSFYADYYVKNLITGKIKLLRTPLDDPEQIRYCNWSPVGTALIFVHKCNIYYVPDVANGTYYRLTRNGVPKKVFNGVPDWVYEEEIISSTHAMEFSPDGKYMAYVTFNASLVPFYRFPKYGPASNMYPSIEKIAYPKAGFPNPTISITVVNLEKAMNNEAKSRNHIIPPKNISQSDFYYAVMKFNNNNSLFIQWMNRAQNRTICMLYGVDDRRGYVVEAHETPNGWIDDDYVKPSFSNDGSYYITMLPKTVPGKGDFRHLAKVNVDDSNVRNSIEFLTTGAFTVQDIKCWDPDEEVVYFRSTEEGTRYRHVYNYSVKTGEKTCVSCGVIKDSDGKDCTYYYPSFSKQCSWMVLLCQGPFIPKSDMIGLKTNRRFVLITNNNTRQSLKEKDVPENVYYTVKSQGFDIPVKETRPKNFDPNTKYAVLFDVYGGPNTQKVTDKFRVPYDWFFVSKNIILVEFDARGTGYYGYTFLYAVYRNLGYYESVDALAVARHLQQQSYVDPDRIAIWGWSYGGFYSATTLAMADKSLIKTAVAVAPVTDWRYYDTVYSERYMGFPSKEDNLYGYESTSVMSKANQFVGKNFMLIHGTADDNVHFQNSAQLASALIKAQVNFRSQFYTDRNHYIWSRYHVYYVIADFLLECVTGKGLPRNSTIGYPKHSW